MCTACKNKMKKKKAKNKNTSSNIRLAGVDEILNAANFKLLGGGAVGVMLGRFVRNKVRNWNLGNETFKMILAGIAEIMAGIYISASMKDEFWQGFATGVGASGVGTILTASGVPGLGNIWNGQFSKGVGKIRRTVTARLGRVSPIQQLPSREEARAKVVNMPSRRRRKRAL